MRVGQILWTKPGVLRAKSAVLFPRQRVYCRCQRSDPMQNPHLGEDLKLLSLNQQLLDCIAEGDYETYVKLCSDDLTCFEPEAVGCLVEGLDFHKWYFELRKGRTGPTSNLTITKPKVRMLGRNAALVTYVRLQQKLDENGRPKTIPAEETRVWEKIGDDWKNVHFHSPVFVTWMKHLPTDGGDNVSDMRGCIGTLDARWLHAALGDFSIRSAFKDQRFNPIDEDEVPFLSCQVSILKNFRSLDSPEDWSIGVHGLIIKFLDPLDKCYRNATFLPHVAKQCMWTHMETIDQLVRKAGYRGVITAELQSSLEVTSYEATVSSLTYDEYIQCRSHQAQAHSRAPPNGFAQYVAPHNGLQ